MKRGNRACSPVSRTELERRWRSSRAAVDTCEVDAFVLEGANNVTGGGAYVRWLCGISAFSSQPHAVIFPSDGLMTAITHGPLNGVWDLSGDSPDFPGVGRRLSSPSFPSVGYTGHYDGELLASELKRHGFRKIGLVGPNNMYYGPVSIMREMCPEIVFVDCTDAIDQLTAIKSDEEIELIRRAANIQDETFQKVVQHIKPGMYDFEVMAYAEYVGQLMGSKSGYYLGCSASSGEPLGHRTRPYQGRQIRDGNSFMWQAETTGPGGYYVHLCRIISFGDPSAQLADAYDQMVEAQQYTAYLLEPGAESAEIFARYNEYMTARNLPEETRLHCHGQGYASVERPLVRHDETMPIAARMNIGIHPSVGSATMFVTVCDNYLTLENGGIERLHKTPADIVVL